MFYIGLTYWVIAGTYMALTPSTSVKEDGPAVTLALFVFGGILFPVRLLRVLEYAATKNKRL